MKSIRLTMVAYFLLLLSAALGAVSWLVYETASKNMREKEQSTADLVAATFQAKIKAEHEAFDQRLLAEAEKLASLSKESSQHHEFYYPFGMLAVPPMPFAHWLLPLWVAEGAHPGLAGSPWPLPVGVPQRGSWLSEACSDKLFERLRLHGIDSQTDSEGRPSEKAADRSNQYVQIERPLYRYNSNEPRLAIAQRLTKSYYVTQYSESLAGHHLPISDKERLQLENYHFDDIALTPTKTLRCVTIKRYAELPRSGRVVHLSEGRLTGKIWCLHQDLKYYEQHESRRDKKGPPPKAPGSSFPQYHSYWEFLPFLFVHYAVDKSTLDGQIRDLESRRDRKLAELVSDTQRDLHDLRRRLGWISLATFLGILIGSWLLIRLGLAPLSRLSDAVSKVTARDIRLHIDLQKLPKELMPIAGRLSETLDQLGKAFAREKQAAADISHELRTPLAALLTTAEVGLKKPRSAEEYREVLQDCKLSGEQMMQLVERLLALARLDANADRLRPIPIDVANLAKQCAELVRPLAEARGLTLKVHARSAVPLLADAGKIREVLTNLLHNAIQYNKPNGSIDLTVDRQNGQLLMQVRDTGIGISAEARAHIFERFYRADLSRHSDTPHAGLGLAIVKSYVDLMGGQIQVDSTSEGSTFRIQVPATDTQLSATSL